MMVGTSFPSTKEDFTRKLFLGKYDATSGSNVDAFIVSVILMVTSCA